MRISVDMGESVYVISSTSDGCGALRNDLERDQAAKSCEQ
jgi:hypothetical protein